MISNSDLLSGFLPGNVMLRALTCACRNIQQVSSEGHDHAVLGNSHGTCIACVDRATDKKGRQEIHAYRSNVVWGLLCRVCGGRVFRCKVNGAFFRASSHCYWVSSGMYRT